MIGLNEVLIIHHILIEKFGGSKGLRDNNLLESALNRPFATFDPSPVEKAVALFESMLINHPFIDGNKRTAYVVMKLILLESGLDIVASDDEKYDMIIAASAGQMRFDEIRSWVRGHCHPNNLSGSEI